MDHPWTPARGRAGRRILVVEDDPDIREALCAQLELWGHDVANAAEGHLALLVAGRHKPEVVLLDLGLPDIDGFEVASRLRAARPGKRPLLIALTDCADDGATCTQASGSSAPTC